ncbi:MAG: zinc-binding protein [Alphaproteobacteria bacterium]|nr:MAG: zinc-binding protein [Alphaproteobacteria bacterium]
MAKKITVYSCSGCSNVAQLANSIAIKLHREKIANMSCIAGVGGDVPSLVKIAHDSEKIIAIDGCALSCVEKCLNRHEIKPDSHIVLTNLNVSKNIFTEASEEKFDEAYEYVLEELELL